MELKIKTVNTMTSSDGSQYGKFTIEPLERGYGITLGNSLRRILSSSLPGSAISSIKIDVHTIPAARLILPTDFFLRAGYIFSTVLI